MSSSSASSNNYAQKAWSSIKRHAKEHHESVNAAYTTYYGIRPVAPERPQASTATSSPRTSSDSIWGNVKRRASDHHKSVNAAYNTLYGIPN